MFGSRRVALYYGTCCRVIRFRWISGHESIFFIAAIKTFAWTYLVRKMLDLRGSFSALAVSQSASQPVIYFRHKKSHRSGILKRKSMLN